MRPLAFAGLATLASAGLAALAAACSPAPALDCTGIENVSTVNVPQTNCPAPRPNDGGFGGTIHDGTYVRTETRWYTGNSASDDGGVDGGARDDCGNGLDGGDAHRQTLVISEGATVIKSVDSKNGNADDQLVFSVKLVNTNLDATLGCGKYGSIRYTYFAVPPNLLYLEDSTSTGGVTKIHTFQKQ